MTMKSPAPSRVEPSTAPQRRGPKPSIHPAAIVESDSIGEGTRIWAFAHVLEGAIVGRDCNIGDHAYIEGGVHIGDRVTIKNGAMLFAGVTVEDDVFIGPGVVFTNDKHPRSPRSAYAAARYANNRWLLSTTVRRGVSLGARATILPGVDIGRYAMVGAAALVTHNVPRHRLVVGQPAEPIAWVCVCGRRIEEPWRCGECGKSMSMRGGQLVFQE